MPETDISTKLRPKNWPIKLTKIKIIKLKTTDTNKINTECIIASAIRILKSCNLDTPSVFNCLMSSISLLEDKIVREIELVIIRIIGADR